MNNINIGIYDEHKLTRESLKFMLQSNKDFHILFEVSASNELFTALNTISVNIILINAQIVNKALLDLLMQINNNYRKTRTLILSAWDSEDYVLKMIKAGAKGFLAKDSGKYELFEAIYTLRNGHDYYSQSITHFLLKQYISKIQNKNPEGLASIKNLSSREIEIIELWGNSFTNKEIADKLYISVRTVESHKNHIMQKLNLKTAVDLVKFAIKNNIIEIH
jgi:DNA-binding NarL/FixJ family response regulator